MPLPLVRAIGGLEVLGALGLLLSPSIGVAPGTAFGAALGLTALQVGATTLHLRRGEARLIGLNVGLFALAAVAAGLATVWW